MPQQQLHDPAQAGDARLRSANAEVQRTTKVLLGGLLAAAEPLVARTTLRKGKIEGAGMCDRGRVMVIS